MLADAPWMAQAVQALALELRVKVRDKWRDDAVWLKRLGYDEKGE